MKKVKATLCRLLAAGTLALGMGAGLAGTGQAAIVVPGPPPTWAEIWNPSLTGQSNTMCLDVPSGSSTSQLRLQLFHCHGYGSDGGPQRWQFIDDGIGIDGVHAYQLRNAANGLCLAFDPATTYIIQTSCDFSGGWELWSENLWAADQQFALVRYPAQGDVRCMSAANATDSNHTPLVLAPCGLWFNDLQLWQLG
jgi:hypothetical protein